MAVEIIGEFHPALFEGLSEVYFRGEKVTIYNAQGEPLIEFGPAEAPLVTAAPAIQPQGAAIGGSLTLEFGSATGQPVPEASWVLTHDGVAVMTGTDLGARVLDLAEAGTYLLTVTWTNSLGSVSSSSAPLVIAAPAVAPSITEAPSILPLTAAIGDSVTLNLGLAEGSPAPQASWDITLNGTSIKSRLDEGMQTMELAEAGTYLLTVTWTNSQGSVQATSQALVVAAPVVPAINYPAVTLAYLDASSTIAGTDADVTSVTPSGTGNFVFSRSGSGNAIQRSASGFTFAGGYYLQTQVLSNVAATDGVFAVIDITITSYGSAVTQLVDGTGSTLKLRNNAGTLQAVGPVSGLGALSLGAVPYGSRLIIGGQIDDVTDLLSGYDVSGAPLSVAHTGLTDPAPTRFITGRYLNGTLHRLAIVGRPEGQAWPITLKEVIEDFRRGV